MWVVLLHKDRRRRKKKRRREDEAEEEEGEKEKKHCACDFVVPHYRSGQKELFFVVAVMCLARSFSVFSSDRYSSRIYLCVWETHALLSIGVPRMHIF